MGGAEPRMHTGYLVDRVHDLSGEIILSQGAPSDVTPRTKRTDTSLFFIMYLKGEHRLMTPMGPSARNL